MAGHGRHCPGQCLGGPGLGYATDRKPGNTFSLGSRSLHCQTQLYSEYLSFLLFFLVCFALGKFVTEYVCYRGYLVCFALGKRSLIHRYLFREKRKHFRLTRFRFNRQWHVAIFTLLSSALFSSFITRPPLHTVASKEGAIAENQYSRTMSHKNPAYEGNNKFVESENNAFGSNIEFKNSSGLTTRETVLVLLLILLLVISIAFLVLFVKEKDKNDNSVGSTAQNKSTGGMVQVQSYIFFVCLFVSILRFATQICGN